ncbi:DNA adenine methylase [Pedobacter frigiditerrae]|uniref:DNA adenine methylase n=1 Tax=Pedobacter frigiditerrae TaxID=2530452 RepID=UPI00292CC523|nr:DNA adenine methylase [Pedobacter frigiditerrae]
MNTKVRPLLKWTGGKFDEFGLFATHIPKFDRYIEPFFGGGGVFFALKPSVQSFINDKSSDLINFYNQIGNEEFKTGLLKYVDAWEQLTEICAELWKTCSVDFIKYVKGKCLIEQFEKTLLTKFLSVFKSSLIFNESDFIIDFPLFQKTVLASITGKTKRIRNISVRENRKFTIDELEAHFETGLRGGVYLFFRELLNKQHKKQIVLVDSKASANWYFVREFCYGSMFRFNKRSEFNIPYGGIAYNRKNFRKKVDKIFGERIIKLFKHSSLSNLDFEVFLKSIDLKPTDFIFLDPPYDSEFSEYDQSTFTQHDQKRLADFLINIAAKWMIIIKETSFIREIYTHSTVKINTFDKNYRYNVKGRNDRNVQHLIITNY